MTRIRCRDRRCAFNKNGICTLEEIEYEPDAGCLTMEPREEIEDDEEWEDDEEEFADFEAEEEEDSEEEDDDDDWSEEAEDHQLGRRRR